jgi:hypothetical protein
MAGMDGAGATAPSAPVRRRRMRADVPCVAVEPGPGETEVSNAPTNALEQCFTITRLSQASQRTNPKFRYACKYCIYFDKPLESSQRALQHAMGMTIHGVLVKGCPARGSTRAASVGIPINLRDVLRAAYGLPCYRPVEEETTLKRSAGEMENSQA